MKNRILNVSNYFGLAPLLWFLYAKLTGSNVEFELTGSPISQPWSHFLFILVPFIHTGCASHNKISEDNGVIENIAIFNSKETHKMEYKPHNYGESFPVGSYIFDNELTLSIVD